VIDAAPSLTLDPWPPPVAPAPGGPPLCPLAEAAETEAEDARSANLGSTVAPLVGIVEIGEQLDDGGAACGVGVVGSPLFDIRGQQAGVKLELGRTDW
jgi:hypothetical protein